MGNLFTIPPSPQQNILYETLLILILPPYIIYFWKSLHFHF